MLNPKADVRDRTAGAHHAGRRKTLLAVGLVTLAGVSALLLAWTLAHRGRGIEAFLGVDGNKYRTVAENPLGCSRAFWDSPYRYQRVLVPTAWWLLGAGRREAIPYASVALNLVAVCLGTVLVGWVLAEGGLSPWWALLYGFAPGLQRALTAGHLEPVGNLLIAAALVAWLKERRRLLLVLLTLLPLVKEVYVVFPVAFFAAEVLTGKRPRWRWGAVFLPLVLWQLYIRWRFGAFGSTYHLFDVKPDWRMLLDALKWNLVVERRGAKVVVLAQLWSLGLVAALVTVLARSLRKEVRRWGRRFDFAQLSLLCYLLLLLAVTHKVAYQLEAFFRVASTALPVAFVAGLGLRPGMRPAREDGSPGADQRDRTFVGMVLMFSGLLSILGVPILFLYLSSLPPALFQGMPMHP